MIVISDLADINMPEINGFELREEILADTVINVKCVPYIFLSTSKTPENVLNAYNWHVQGYLKKEHDFLTFKMLFKTLLSIS